MMKAFGVLLFVIFGCISKGRGGFEVSVTLNSYQNPEQRCMFCGLSNGGCDADRSGCDNIFTYCLQDLGRCSNNLTTQVNPNGNPINFNDSSVLGVPNPFKLTRSDSLLKNIKLVIIVKDGLEPTLEIVDIFNIYISGNAVLNPITRNYTGLYNIATVGLSYRVICHGSSTNSCIDYCTEADCGPGQCTNVVSNKSYYCTCPDNTYSRHCNYCQGVNCGMGLCEELDNGYTCNCMPTYTGANCETDLCDGFCMNEGTCMRDSDGPRCQCNPPHEGDTCNERDNCYNVNCNGGTCEDRGSTYECRCTDDRLGQHCELANYCYLTPLNCNTGYCISGTNSAYCLCSPPFIGDRCEIRDTCFGIQCNSGNCSRGNDSYACNCPPEFTGRNCHRINYCNNVDCGSGTCVNEDTTFSCNCTVGFTGNYCETNIDECENITCNEQGKCYDGNNSYSCLCENGFYGKLCEESIEISANKTIQSTESMKTSTIFLSIWIVGGLVVSIIVLISLIVVCLTVMHCNKQKAETLNLNENSIIGDNPVYMAVNDPRNVDQERLFINSIYGAPDYTLYASPGTSSREKSSSLKPHANQSTNMLSQSNSRTEGSPSTGEVATTVSTLQKANGYVESHQYEQIVRNGHSQGIKLDTAHSAAEEKHTEMVPEGYEVPVTKIKLSKSQESLQNMSSTSKESKSLKKLPLLPPRGCHSNGINS